MFNIFKTKKYKKLSEELEQRWLRALKANLPLRRTIVELRTKNEVLQEHLQAMATLCGALSDVLTEEQKKSVSKSIKIRTKKKGKKDGK